jgi:hypothetical protein
MRRKKTAILLAAALTALYGCDNGPGPSAPDPGEPSAAASPRGNPFGGTPRLRSYDAELEDLVAEIPGFGGIFAENGRLHVYVKGGRGLNANERAALGRFMSQRVSPRSRPARGVDDLVVLPARYDYRELRRMYRDAGNRMGTAPVTITDIDERNNRLMIGMRDAASAGAMIATLRRAGIPDDAVVVQVVPPTELDVGLQDYVRPTLPGTRIAAPGGCTLSFSGYHAYGHWTTSWNISYAQAYFVTNSHCTSTYVGYDGSTAGQPSLSYPIGYEIADPAPFTNAQNTECPVGRYCRWADAALFQYSSGISPSYPNVPTVSGLTITGSRAITGYDMPWFIWGPMSVRKIGATSGESSGSLTTTCAAIPVYDNGSYQGVDMLCQYQASYSSSGGDSGSPVLNPASDSTTVLHGVHWGRQYNPIGTTIYATFSPMGSMQVELEAASNVHIVPCDACIGWWIE